MSENFRPTERLPRRSHKSSEAELVEALTKLDFSYLFDYLTLKKLVPLFTMKRIPHRSAVYRPGEPRDAIYGLVQGYVKLMREDKEGEHALFDIVPPGILFGDDVLYSGGVRDRIAIAYEAITVLRIAKDDFLNLLNEHPKLYEYMFRNAGERLRRAEERVMTLSFDMAGVRLAKVLSELALRYGTVQENGTVMINLKLPHREIADLVGSTRESVTSHLNDLRRREVIEIRDRRIVVNDIRLLATNP